MTAESPGDPRCARPNDPPDRDTMKAPILTLLALAGIGLGAQAQTAVAGDAARGAARVAMCIGCHGIVGYRASFPEVYQVPKIAGQSAGYIAAALEAYRRGERRHPTMRAVAASLSAQDMADLGAYYEQLGPPPAPAPEQPALAMPPALKDRLQACTACHGSNFSKPIDGYPRLAGQHADYLLAALRAYTVDGNPSVGRGNPVMRSQVLQDNGGKTVPAFTPAELQQVAAYIAALPGELRTVPQARTR